MELRRVDKLPLSDSKSVPSAAAATDRRLFPGLPDDERWELALRVVASRSFAKSSFLINFLLYVCDRQLRGRSVDITENQIGVHAFGRPANYNPGEDNIVRNYARLLRKRLDEYFENEGREEPLRISMPVGHYVPVFRHAEVEPQPLKATPGAVEISVVPNVEEPHLLVDIVEPVIGTRVIGTRLLGIQTIATRSIAISVLALCALLVGYAGFRHLQPGPASLSQQFWSQMFNHDRETLVVPADSGFGIQQNLMGHPVHLGDYVTGSDVGAAIAPPGVNARNWKDLRTQQYTSMVDLRIALSLSRLPAIVPERFALRYTRDLRMEDLKHSNAVLLGSAHTNPWDELFQKDLNFSLEYQAEVDDSVVVNRHPAAGESAVYNNAWADESHRTYTVVAFVPSLDGKGHVLLLEGLNMAGTQAAADFLLNEQSMEPVIAKARQREGVIGPFELLLETSSIGANAPEARVVAARYQVGLAHE